MTTTEAIDLLKSQGYRVTKPKPRPAPVAALNAVGKPYSPQYDPKYRVKYRTPPTPAGLSTAADLSEARVQYRTAIARKHQDLATVQEICARQGCGH